VSFEELSRLTEGSLLRYYGEAFRGLVQERRLLSATLYGAAITNVSIKAASMNGFMWLNMSGGVRFSFRCICSRAQSCIVADLIRIETIRSSERRSIELARKELTVRLARWIFWLAGLYGLAVILPQYFLLDKISRDSPPAVTHPEYFYGFVGVAAAWQIAFLIIGSDPLRFRPLMFVGALEKLSFGIPVALLFARQQVAGDVFIFGMIDLLLAAAFVVAWWITGKRAS
jgi:hypothetical protein